MIFKAFFSNKRGGLGLGIAVCRTPLPGGFEL